jgi:hypothetical protein
LNQVAIETGLPIIVAAQFNRSVTNKHLLHATNLSETGDIERIASLIIGFWNSNCPSKPASSGSARNDEDVPNTLHVEVLKHRDGELLNMKGTWGFDGNQSRIIMDTATNQKRIIAASGKW